MSDPNVIAQLPLRVYTPIKDLQYNESVADDIRELPDFLNVNIGEMKSLAPVVCQSHEPHESLRLVPWVKPTVAEEPDEDPEEPPIREEIQRGVWHWVNGRWLPMVPEYETLSAIEDEVDLALIDISDYNDAVDDYKADVDLQVIAVEGVYDDCNDEVQVVREHYIRAMQFAAQNGWLFGQEEDLVIPQGTGIYDPTGRPAGHVFIDFSGPALATQYTDTTDLYAKYYRAYCHPAAYLGTYMNLGDIWSEGYQLKGGPVITSRPNLGQWNRIRNMWNSRKPYANPTWPDIDFPEMGISGFAYYFGYDPTDLPHMSVEITNDSKLNNFLHATINYRIDTFELEPGVEVDAVRGAYIWFTDYDPAGTGGSTCPAFNGDRTISFNWTVFGKRKTPPELWTT